MTIFGKTLSDYISFTKLFIVLILLVGFTRLALSLAGMETSIVKWISITAVLLVGLFYYPIKLHVTGFGSYRHLLPVVYIQGILSQAIVILGIAIAIFTAKDNVFSLPEFSGGVEGKTWSHIAAHAIVGLVLPLAVWLVGCLILFITKKISPKDRGSAAEAHT